VNFLPIFHPRIETDVREAVAYFERRSLGLGARFKLTFYAAVDSILVFPEKHAVKVEEDIRTRLLRPFPYLIFYAVERDFVCVLTVQYAGQRPASLQAIVQERRAN
jgi:hypothetical protein